MVVIRSITINGGLSATVQEGGTATVFVDATSDMGGLAYNWRYVHPITFADSAVVTENHTNALIIHPCDQSDAGQYYCHVHDVNDSDDTSRVTLIVSTTTTHYPTTTAIPTTTTWGPTTTTTPAPTTTLMPVVPTLKFSKIDVINTKDNYRYIEWEVSFDALNNDSADNYMFYLYKSRDPVSDFEILTVDNSDAPIAIDGATGPLAYIDRLKQYDFNQEHYYRIEAVHKHIPSLTTLSQTVWYDGNFDGIHDTMRYAEQILYEMYQGEPIFVVKQKTTGTRCPKCWSPYRQQRTISDCDVCHGSGFAQGYFCPIQIQASFDSTPKKIDIAETGEDQTAYIRCRTSNYPIMKPRDIVVNKDTYIRYMVVSIEFTKLPNLSKSRSVLSQQNYILSQILTLKEINASDPQYHIPLPDCSYPIPPMYETYIFSGGSAESGDVIWYINGNTGCSNE